MASANCIPSSVPSFIAFSAATMALPAALSAGSATSSSISRRPALGSPMPTSWLMVRKVPPIDTSPPSASSSPDRMRKTVLLPTPLGPTMAAWSPGATPKLTSKNKESAAGGA